MIQTAKAIAANAEQISRYATSVAEQCQDERYTPTHSSIDTHMVTYTHNGIDTHPHIVV